MRLIVFWRRVALAISLVLGSALSALPQAETGQISGRVLDPNGAVVAGATVTVKSVGTGAERTTTTTDEGFYTVTNLQPGLYDITVKATGFNPATQRTQVTVGSRNTVDFTLAVAAVSGGTVEVVAGGGLEVNTQTQELSTVVSENQIRQLPTVTRDPYALVSLAGNVSTTDPTGRGVGVAINGQRAASTNVLLDGVENVNTFTASVGQSIPLDAVQEFRVVTGTFTPEYGRASGGVVNVATKSGTNEFHGTLYEFNRVSRLSSNSFDNNANGLKKGVFARNQFGYAIGGPVILPNFNGRDKLFFFNSTEWIRVRSTAPVINLVPTPQLIAASAPATQAFFSTYGQLATQINGTIYTVGDVINKLGLPSTGPFASLPPNLPAFGQVRYQRPGDQGGGDPQNTYLTVTRIDWNVSDRTQVYGRYGIQSQKLFAGTVSFSPYQGYNTGENTFNQNALVSITHTFSPRFVSQTKLSYNRLNDLQPLSDKGDVPTLYLFPNTPGSIDGFNIAFPGFLPFSPGSGIPFGGPQNVGEVAQDLSYTLSRHQLRFGGAFVYIQDNRTFGAYETASETLGRQGRYSEALNNFVSGQLRQFQAAINPQGKFPGDTIQLPVGPPQFSRSNRYREFYLYFNDAYRVRPRITVNLGLRYEYYGVQHNKDPRLDSNFYFGSGQTIFERIRNGRVFRAPESPVGGLWRPDKNNFAPRLGFAWDLFGDGKTSLRGGYGIAYERNFGNVTFNVIQNPPNYAVISIIAGTDVPSIPISVSNVGPLAGTGSKVLPVTSLRHVREDIRTAYAHLYSLSFEHELARRTIVSVEFTGSAGRKLYSIANINRTGTGLRYLNSTTPLVTGGTTSRLNGQYSNINSRGSDGRSNYNALVASIESDNFRNYGLNFGARYTYAVTKDNLSSTFSESGNNFNLGYLDPFNPSLDYGYSDFDVRHRFISNFSWDIPVARNARGFARQAFGGWTLAGIIEARTGSPFTVYDCTNALTTCIRLVPTAAVSFKGSGNPAPISGTPNRFNYIDLSRQTPSDFTDVSGFTEVGPFPSGMTRRNAFRGPGYWNVDGAVYKSFFFGEKYRLQLRGEFFNIFNHPNLFIRGGETDISSFNYVPAFRNGRRNVQLALKFIF